jgi:signal transduction histidine kinase
LTGDVLYRRDLLQEDTYGLLKARQGDFDTPIRSVLDVPFTHGSLAVNSPEPNAFSERHTAVLQQLAGVISEGFQRLEDLRKLEERNRELEQEIDKRKDAEVEAHKARDDAEAANRAKSVFLANMSHELRTPLNAILGFTQLMSRDDTLSAEQRENLDIVGRSGEHLLNLINDVLEMSRIEAGRTELRLDAIDLFRLLDNLEEMFRLRTPAAE